MNAPPVKGNEREIAVYVKLRGWGIDGGCINAQTENFDGGESDAPHQEAREKICT